MSIGAVSVFPYFLEDCFMWMCLYVSESEIDAQSLKAWKMNLPFELIEHHTFPPRGIGFEAPFAVKLLRP